jgi:hypothetical protein
MVQVTELAPNEIDPALSNLRRCAARVVIATLFLVRVFEMPASEAHFCLSGYSFYSPNNLPVVLLMM